MIKHDHMTETGQGLKIPECKRAKIVSIMWNSYAPMLKRADKKLGLGVTVYAARQLEENPVRLEEAKREMGSADMLLLYRTRDLFWEGLENQIKELGKRIPIVCLSSDPSYWSLSTVKPNIVVTAQSYLTLSGDDNIKNLLLYLANAVLGRDVQYVLPAMTPWEGIFHPRAPSYFNDVDEYLSWYKSKSAPMIGILCSRLAWAGQSLEIENALIEALETKGLNVIPIFSYSVKDPELGAKGLGDVVSEWLIKDGRARVDAIIKLNPFFLGSSGRDAGDTAPASNGVELLKKMNVPVFEPIITSYASIEDWESSNGLSSDVGWSVAMPEFEGVIEPIIIGAGNSGAEHFERSAIMERCEKLAIRVRKWATLRHKPVGERKVAFILHNSPCASVEASVGGAAHLDSLESVARILKVMKAAGYNVDVPENGKALIDNIMDKKAVSEFRWTPVEEIVRRGGCLKLIHKEDYELWFMKLSTRVRKLMIDAWGLPPGEYKDGIPAAMVYKGSIVVTGVCYGNAVVCAQPKRGCAGSRCDGQVCKILHDPDVPPTHQYLATYRYLEDDFGADVIIHVGTHGNMEFLPGKGVGLSADCFPDIAIGTAPHVYIYNADNPPEGTIAKRRGYACLVDHMQTVHTQAGLYGDLEEVDRLLEEYETAKYDKAREHALGHLLMDAIKKANLDCEIRLTHGMPVSGMVAAAHEALGRIRNTQIPAGMHIFGVIPQGDKRVALMDSIMKFDDGDGSLRSVVASSMGLDIGELISHQGKFSESRGKSYGALLQQVDEISSGLIRHFIYGEGSAPEDIFGEAIPYYKDRIEAIRQKALEIDGRISDSDELGSLMNVFGGGYVPAGPSGLITRGRDDVLPTGRNFYSLDPKRVPTKSAWKVGMSLADSILKKHMLDTGRMPENVAYYWMSNDIMWSDGEGMAMVMYLLGVRPLWHSNGRRKGFEIIPLADLKRPRIDVTIKVSGITRDNFSDCIEYIDESVQTVASLDEPLDMNYPRKHALTSLGDQSPDNGDAWRDATLRIFASKPGTYMSGVNLAVYASAWKEEKDLADIFVFFNGYAYGKGVAGKESRQQFVDSLKTVDMTFNKAVTDEYDLLSCCCNFSNHGGLTAAARNASSKEVKTYYGDTREPGHVEVRDLADEIRRVARAKLLNPKWIDGMKEHGYKGAGDMMKRIGRIYGWEASTGEVDDWVFDDIARTFVLDKDMKKFFEENNPFALEEISRRLLEARKRELWNPDPDVLKGLIDSRLEIEGWMEERAGEGAFQGGSIDVLSAAEVEGLGEQMKAAMNKLHR